MTAYGWRSMAGGFAAMLAVMPNAAAQTPTTPAPAHEIRQDSPGAHELTIDSPVRDIVALPGGKAIIDRIKPNFTLHPLLDKLRPEERRVGQVSVSTCSAQWPPIT